MCLPFYLSYERRKVKNMNKRRKRKSDVKSNIIKRQADEIKALKKKINELNISSKEKDELIHAVEPLQKELIDTIENVREKGEEYDKLIEDVKVMRKVFDKEIFMGRWNIIRFLMKLK